MNRVDACFELARAAAELLRSFQGHTHTTYKAERDPVTEADRSVEAMLEREIRERFPEDGFLGEEGTEVPSRSGFTWVADPLDGTVNFAHGHGHFAVSLAVARDGSPLAGAVASGAAEEIFTAERGAGAFHNGRRMRVSDRDELRCAMAATGFPYDTEGRTGRGLRRMEALLRHCESVRVMGCASLDLCRVAAGLADLYIGDGTKAWDVAAGMVILEEAGGRITDWDGGPLSLDAPGRPLASNGRLHEAALGLCRGFAC